MLYNSYKTKIFITKMRHASASSAARTTRSPGGYWYCPGGCSHCFHTACAAEAKGPEGEPLDGANKVCMPCHVAAMSRGRGARGRAARQRVE